MSTLPTLYPQRRRSIALRPKRIGGIFTLDVGQFQGAFLDKDYYLPNRTSIGVLTNRTFENRRYRSLDSSNVFSASYGSYRQNLTYIPEQNCEVDDAYSFRLESLRIINQLKMCSSKINQSQKQISQFKQQMQNIQKLIEKQLNQTETAIVFGFKQLRTKLFDFSRNYNNIHLILVKRQLESLEKDIKIMKDHSQYADKKFKTMNQQLKGKEEFKQTD